ncbi:hypothetical protein J6590_089233 [Homalodisca vitripennis]|nr:hypothetical protein J6590_089233 [Homalodisca vitripennis]
MRSSPRPWTLVDLVLAYRHQRILKNGEVSWRCLGKSCSASIKTDAGMMQWRTSCYNAYPLITASEIPNCDCCITCGACCALYTTCAGFLCNTRLFHTATDLSLSDDLPGLRQELDAANKIPEDPLTEISRLRKEIERLESEYQMLLNHTIESDTRLLEFTDQIFQVSTSRVDQTARASATDHLPTAVDFAVAVHRATQTDQATVESAVQSESSSQPSCQLTDSAVQCELLGPRVEVEVLEAEVQCLNLQSITGEDKSMSEQPWTRVVHKKTAKEQNYKKVQNTHYATKYKPNKPKHRRRKNKNMRNQITQAPKTLVQFKTVGISGYSHARHLAGLVGELVAPATTVSGICKPGAKLLNILRPSPTHNSHCEMLIAGSNDLADGEQKNIYLHLERQIAARPTNTVMVIVTLPHRHDLEPDNPIHLETALVNAFIQELAVRYGTRVVDFYRINRQCFTAHGQHLNMSGKRKLAELVVESLAAECTVPLRKTEAPRPTLRNEGASSETAELFVLPHDSYAEAVKKTLDKEPVF